LALVAMATVASANEAKDIADCNSKCKEQKDGSEANISACQSGCTFYTQKESDRAFFGVGFFRDSNDVLFKCNNDCRNSFREEKERLSCGDGCGLMRDSSKAEDDEAGSSGVFPFGNGGIRISFGSLPEMPEMPKMSSLLSHVNQMVKDQSDRVHKMLFSGDEKEKQDEIEERTGSEVREFEPLIVHQQQIPAMSDVLDGEGAFGGIFQRMQNHMNNMMQNLFHEGGAVADLAKETAAGDAAADRDENGKLVHGGGKLVVIKSGPGYHSERTYRLGPDADIEKILVESSMNDMMNHQNPMEQFFQKDQVEVFDPLAAKEKADGNAEIKPASFGFIDTDPWGLIKTQLGLKDDAKESPVASAPADREPKVVDLDGPRLPETGLRSRHHQVFRFSAADVCMIKPRSQMTWNEWFNCLHIRMGVPNWLLVATVALGVIFTLWLCLVIPSNAPKQKVRKPKMVDTQEQPRSAPHPAVTIDPKELEAMGTLTVLHAGGVDLKAVDLPPSYDDIVTTKVGAAAAAAKDETKIVLCDDTDIVEPLPQKVKLDNNEEERNCSNV